MINEALSAIINLLKLKKDVKKTDLEIEKLERERKKEKSMINIASFDDIKKYDPRAKNIYDAAERIEQHMNRLPREHDYNPAAKRQPSLWGWLLSRVFWLSIVFYIIYIIYKYVI